MARYQVILAYDGTSFQGFQRQAGVRTVQGEVEAALHALGWQGVSLLAAGRTDSGTHAAGQVIAFDLDWQHDGIALQAALNAHLPGDIAALQARLARPDFHPRFDALGRRYRYHLFCQAERSPLRERYAWRVWPQVTVEALQPLAAQLLGRHDFAAFGTPPVAGGSTLRTVAVSRWRLAQTPAGEPELVFEISAEAFLYRMVRRLVYAQVAAAQGRGEPPARLLADPPPAPIQGLAPACGLVLAEVGYPADATGIA